MTNVVRFNTSCPRRQGSGLRGQALEECAARALTQCPGAGEKRFMFSETNYKKGGPWGCACCGDAMTKPNACAGRIQRIVSKNHQNYKI